MILLVVVVSGEVRVVASREMGDEITQLATLMDVLFSSLCRLCVHSQVSWCPMDCQVRIQQVVCVCYSLHHSLNGHGKQSSLSTRDEANYRLIKKKILRVVFSERRA